MHPTYLNSIKTFEGFAHRAQWDYAQHTNGYGTRALFAGETITADEAERRFRQEIAAARAIVDKHAGDWDEGTKAALTSLTFNAGTRWISSGLGEAVRAHDLQGVKERFVEYSKAQGQVLPGLVSRRLAEADWIGRSEPVAATPAAQPGTEVTVNRRPSTPPLPDPGLTSTPLTWSVFIALLFDMQIRSANAATADGPDGSGFTRRTLLRA